MQPAIQLVPSHLLQSIGTAFTQVLPFSMEVRDSLLLLVVVGFCVWPVFGVIVGVYRGAVVCVVPLSYRSILREKCVIGMKMYVGCWQCAKGLWVMCSGTCVWAHVVELLVHAWVSCSSHRSMYGEASPYIPRCRKFSNPLKTNIHINRVANRSRKACCSVRNKLAKAIHMLIICKQLTVSSKTPQILILLSHLSVLLHTIKDLRKAFENV